MTADELLERIVRMEGVLDALAGEVTEIGAAAARSRVEIESALMKEMKATQEFHVEMLRTMQAELKEVKKIGERIDTEMTRYKGFLGGITFLLGAIGVAAAFFKTWLFAKLGLPI